MESWPKFELPNTLDKSLRKLFVVRTVDIDTVSVNTSLPITSEFRSDNCSDCSVNVVYVIEHNKRSITTELLRYILYR